MKGVGWLVYICIKCSRVYIGGYKSLHMSILQCIKALDRVLGTESAVATPEWDARMKYTEFRIRGIGGTDFNDHFGTNRDMRIRFTLNGECTLKTNRSARTYKCVAVDAAFVDAIKFKYDEWIRLMNRETSDFVIIDREKKTTIYAGYFTNCQIHLDIVNKDPAIIRFHDIWYKRNDTFTDRTHQLQMIFNEISSP